ncbi:hypothetical protein [Fulvivirga sediminis]|uniref:Bacterial surface antigen (D15) domain-containing protein n=1 Tax=Fulvivirga sediminis TaxID=2803949 RepID=A0A937K0F8_9BACT|nr:hypothetical protein [Fulvivirga sediminis]MBL3655497.1 hypothetical protein [Fulvivirga sediminis]
MKKFHIFLVLFAFCVVSHTYAQSRKDNQPVTYEELYDEPYAINKLFVQFQPVYGELWKANINAGFGLEATYFWKEKMTFRAHARKTYAQSFDLTRDIAENMIEDNPALQAPPRVLNFYEFGATYHVKDFEESSKTKMFLYRKSYKGDKWAARVPLNAEIPCKVRKIYGARLGGMFFDTAVDINRVLEAQDMTITEAFGEEFPAQRVNNMGEMEETSIFSGVDVKGAYLGGSMTWIRNVAVDFDNKYQEGVDDLILTAFFDILIAPAITVDDIIYGGRAYSADNLETTMFGFRAGIDGKFNRTLSWGYGGEIGVRPGLKGQGFYALIKVSFPVFSTNLEYSVEAFGK